MKRTYTRTTFIENLADAKITLYIYENTKYDKEIGETWEVTYNGIKGWDIIEGGKEAAEIEAKTDADGIDEHHEYLVLHFLSGKTGTFRNSHVDMFIR